MAKFFERLKNAWNAFQSRDRPEVTYNKDLGMASYSRPDRRRSFGGNEKSLITSIYNRIAMDCASIRVEHVRLDDKNRYSETIDSTLNDCLTLEANKDQTARAFIQDVVYSMLDEGSVAIVPVDTNINPVNSASFDILTLRTAEITQWYPNDVKLRLYDENDGLIKEILMPKRTVAIVENPFYEIMNEPNSTMQRLIRKLNLLDAVDEQSGSGKLNMLIQLPYVVKSEDRKKQAELRRKELEHQLTEDKFGIGYIDGTERVVQLGHPIENNMLDTVDYLVDLFYGQLGITTEIMNGSASQEVMQNYMSRVIEPIMSAITDELKRKFLTKTARTQRQSIVFFNDPFRLVPADKIAELADKLTRNEIMSSNEFRQIIGLKPSDDPAADELRNKNINQSAQAEAADGMLPVEGQTSDEYDSAAYDSQISELEALASG